MTQDEIIDMARQAGIDLYKHEVAKRTSIYIAMPNELEAFAKLVDAKATAKEREACAIVAENGCNYPCADEIAEAIRARGTEA